MGSLPQWFPASNRFKLVCKTILLSILSSLMIDCASASAQSKKVEVEKAKVEKKVAETEKAKVEEKVAETEEKTAEEKMVVESKSEEAAKDSE